MGLLTSRGGFRCGTGSANPVARSLRLVPVVLVLSAMFATAAPANYRASATHSISGYALLSAISCGSPTTCVAVGQHTQFDQFDDFVVTITNGVPGTPTAVSGDYRAIACRTATSCVAVGYAGAAGGAVVPITNGIPGTVQHVPNTVLQGVACTTTANCYAVGDGSGLSGVVVPIIGGAPGAVQNVTNSLGAIACPSASACYASGPSVDDGGLSPGVIEKISLANPSAPSPGKQQKVNGNQLHAIACPTAASCVSGGVNSSNTAVVVPVVNGTPGKASNGSGNLIFSLACGTTTRCVGVGSYGDVYTVLKAVIAGDSPMANAALYSVACVSATTCYAGGYVAVGPRGSHTHAAAVITLTYLAAPAKPNLVSQINKQARSAKFTFSAPRASGFQCALVKGAAKPSFSACSSPKSYKSLKTGAYTFEVRGINQGGTGPVAKKAFTI